MAAFELTMDIYTDDTQTGHHNRPTGRRESKEFNSAEEMSAWWEENKSYERKGKSKAKARKNNKPGQKLREELGEEFVNKLIADSGRSIG